MHPKIARRAFQPLSITRADSPRGDHIARNGGNRSRSVSSSTSTMLRGGKLPSTRRSRLFFLALRIRRQHITRPLPDVPKPMQVAPDRIVGVILFKIPAQLIAQ